MSAKGDKIFKEIFHKVLDLYVEDPRLAVSLMEAFIPDGHPLTSFEGTEYSSAEDRRKLQDKSDE